MEKTYKKDEISKHIKVIADKIEKFLPEESLSDVLIIKAHLICEYYLNQILILKEACKAEEVDILSFYNKVNKSLDLKYSDQKNIHTRLLKLNTLRNKIGHELEYTLSESDVDNLGYLTGKEYVVSKYEFETKEELLRDILIHIIVSIALVVFDLVDEEKKKNVSEENKN